MAALPVTENSVPDTYHPCIEIVNFTTQSTDGDYYDVKRLGHVENVLVSQETADGTEIQASWANQTNKRPRVTLVPTVAATTGTLIIFGRK